MPPPLSLPLDTSVTTVDVPMLATAEFGRGNMMMVGSRHWIFTQTTPSFPGVVQLAHVQGSLWSLHPTDGQADAF